MGCGKLTAVTQVKRQSCVWYLAACFTTRCHQSCTTSQGGARGASDKRGQNRGEDEGLKESRHLGNSLCKPWRPGTKQQLQNRETWGTASHLQATETRAVEKDGPQAGGRHAQGLAPLRLRGLRVAP